MLQLLAHTLQVISHPENKYREHWVVNLHAKLKCTCLQLLHQALQVSPLLKAVSSADWACQCRQSSIARAHSFSITNKRSACRHGVRAM